MTRNQIIKSLGFTLLELLIVLTIISVLTLVAVPQYKEYRARAYDTVAQLDLKNTAIAEEAYYFDAERYLACADSSCLDLPGLVAFSRGVGVNVEIPDADYFIARAQHESGTGRTFVWDSSQGGMQ